MDWKGSFPRMDEETLLAWRARLHSLRSNRAAQVAIHDPERRRKRLASSRAWKMQNAERAKKARLYRYDKQRAAALHRAARERARVKGLPFTLSLLRVQDAIEGGCCEATGLPFDMNTKRGAFSPSIDRISGCDGYSDEGVLIVCWGFNVARLSFPIAHTIEIAAAITRRAPDLESAYGEGKNRP